MNVARSGWLSDKVNKLGWESTLAKNPEAASFVDRLRAVLERSVGGRATLAADDL